MDPHIFKLREKLSKKIEMRNMWRQLEDFKKNPEEKSKYEQQLIIKKMMNTYIEKIENIYSKITDENETYVLLNKGPRRRKLKRFQKGLNQYNKFSDKIINDEEIEKIAKTDKMRRIIKSVNLKL